MERKQRNTLILALVLLAVLAAFLVHRHLTSREGIVAMVLTDGQAETELDLSKDQELWVGDPETGRNLIRVENGTVAVVQADCPDKICVYTGPISQEGEVIACLPHGLLVYIQREGK